MRPLVFATGIILAASFVLPYFKLPPGDPATRNTSDLWITSTTRLVPAGPIRNGHTLTQTFTATSDRLSTIDFLGATYGIPISSGAIQVTLTRFRPPLPPEPLVSRQIDARTIADNQYIHVAFPPLPDSKGQPYVLSIQPVNLPQAAMFTVWLTQDDLYPQGSVSIDGVPNHGDLVMTASHRSSLWETLSAGFIVFAVAVAISLYFFSIGLASLLTLKTDPKTLPFLAPAAGVALVGLVAIISVFVGRLLPVNVCGGLLLACFAGVTLFKNRRKLVSIPIAARSILFYLALVAVCCCITSQPQTIPHTDVSGGPWRSFVPIYPGDGLIPYESASIIANHLKPQAFIFEPRWSIGDRTHLLTLLYLHFCQFFGFTPAHTPQGPWDILDHYGFWLLRCLAFATNSFVLLGVAGIGSLILGKVGKAILPALVLLSPFILMNASYSWPKLLCAYLLMAGVYLLIRKEVVWAGMAFGLAYWAHPMANLFYPGACVFAWMLDKDRRASMRDVLRLAAVLVISMGTAAGFSAAAFHRVAGGSFYLYPLATGYHVDTARDPAVVLRDFRATPAMDLLAIRLANLMRFIFPTDIIYSTVPLQPGLIWETVKWNWLRIYGGSLWGATGLLLFPIAVYGIYLSRQQREIWALALTFIAVPAAAYVLWMGFPMDLGGLTTCQPIVAIALIFASLALQGCSQTAVLAIVTAIALEMQFALAIPYRGGTLGVALAGTCLMAIGTIWIAMRPQFLMAEAVSAGETTTVLEAAAAKHPQPAVPVDTRSKSRSRKH